VRPKHYEFLEVIVHQREQFCIPEISPCNALATEGYPTLASEASCRSECIPAGRQLAVLIYLFAKIANMTVTPSTLASEARCIDSCIPAGSQLAVLIYLAAQIGAGGGGGGGVGTHIDGTMPANIPAPANPATANVVYAANGTSPTYTWNITNQAWQ
jgi:hypothetical protein